MDHVKSSGHDAAAELESILPQLLHAAEADLPVLPATLAELDRLRVLQERLAPNALAAAVLRDPFLTLRVLRHLVQHRTRSQSADITTVGHAIMMLGQARFFEAIAPLPCLETRVQGETLAALRRLASRARLAALLARDWAGSRHDLEPEEVMVAALLHTIPEALAVLREAVIPTACEARRALHAAVFAGLAVPGLAARMYDDTPAHDMRRWNVRLACRLARDCSAGWPRASVTGHVQELQRLLHTSETQAWERVRKPLLAAAREWHYYDVLPAAARMPMIPCDDGAG